MVLWFEVVLAVRRIIVDERKRRLNVQNGARSANVAIFRLFSLFNLEHRILGYKVR
jgi:hypothetical protein